MSDCESLGMKNIAIAEMNKPGSEQRSMPLESVE
jgi:hypothetical protein